MTGTRHIPVTAELLEQLAQAREAIWTRARAAGAPLPGRSVLIGGIHGQGKTAPLRALLAHSGAQSLTIFDSKAADEFGAFADACFGDVATSDKEPTT